MAESVTNLSGLAPPRPLDLEEDKTLRPERYISSESQHNMYGDKPFGHEVIALINQRQFPSDNQSS